jgi:hypothetical protein
MSNVHKKGSNWDEKKVLECKDWIFYLSITINIIIKISFSFFLFINNHFSYLSNSNIADRLNIKTNKLDRYHIYIYICIPIHWMRISAVGFQHVFVSFIIISALAHQLLFLTEQISLSFLAYPHIYSFRTRTTVFFGMSTNWKMLCETSCVMSDKTCMFAGQW